jgi:hypothetical protein
MSKRIKKLLGLPVKETKEPFWCCYCNSVHDGEGKMAYQFIEKDGKMVCTDGVRKLKEVMLWLQPDLGYFLRLTERFVIVDRSANAESMSILDEAIMEEATRPPFDPIDPVELQEGPDHFIPLPGESKEQDNNEVYGEDC